MISTLSFMAGMGIGSAVFLLVSLWCLFGKGRGRAPLLASGLPWAVLAYFLACLASVAAALLAPPLGLPLQGFGELQKFHFFLLPFLTCAALVDGSKDELRYERHPMWTALLGMGLFVSVVGIAQFWAESLFPEAWLKSRFFRVVPTTGHSLHFHAQGLMFFHLSYASAMSFVVSWAGGRALWPPKGESRAEAFSWRSLALLSSLALFYSYSRIGWVALAAVCVTLGFLKRPKWGGFACLGVLALSVLLWHGSSSLRERWNLSFGSIVEREGVWTGALAMIQDRPLTGVGFGKTGYYSRPYTRAALGHEPIFTSHAHNNVLDILAGTGILGLTSWLWWWILLGLYAWRSFRDSLSEERWLPAACLAGLVAFQVNGLTQVNFFDAKSQHSLMLWAGVILALEWRRTRRSFAR